jgi:alkyl hydroperoxide reductase subunit AhpC
MIKRAVPGTVGPVIIIVKTRITNFKADEKTTAYITPITVDIIGSSSDDERSHEGWQRQKVKDQRS